MKLQGKTILIVEDEMTNYMLLEEYLEPTEASIIWAKTGEEALEMYKTNSPHLILLDIRLPDMSGIDIVKVIRQTDSQTPIIAQTAFAMSSDRERFLAMGCSEYLSKPITEEKFIGIIGKYFL